MRTLPASSTAAQKLAVAHETESKKCPLASMLSGDDQELPLYVTASPLFPTATQKSAVAHDTDPSSPAPLLLGEDHDVSS